MTNFYRKLLDFGLILETIFSVWAFTNGLPPFLSFPIIALGIAVRKSTKFLHLVSLQSLCFLDIGFYGQLLINKPDTVSHSLYAAVTIIIIMKFIKIYALHHLFFYMKFDVLFSLWSPKTSNFI